MEKWLVILQGEIFKKDDKAQKLRNVISVLISHVLHTFGQRKKKRSVMKTYSTLN